MEDKTLEQPTMSLYDYSKQLVANEEPMDVITLNKTILNVAEDMLEYKYWMLLCNDRRDYTVFNISSYNNGFKTKDLISNELVPTLLNRGQVLLVDKQPDGSYEIWIRDPETLENFAYYLFKYEGVIEIE